MIFVLLLLLSIMSPVRAAEQDMVPKKKNGMHHTRSTTSYTSPGGFTITQIQGSISFDEGIPVDEFAAVLHEITSKDAAEHDAAAASPYGKTLLTLLHAENATEQQIYDHLKTFPHDQLEKIKPLQSDIKKLVHPTLRSKIKNIVAEKRVDFHRYTLEKSKRNKDIGLINYFNVHAPELTEPTAGKNLDIIDDLFTIHPVVMHSDHEDAPNGYFKTDQNFIVQIDHEEVKVGQETEWGKIIAINPAETIVENKE